MKDGDQLALRFVEKDTSPTPEATLETDLGGGEEPVIKKARVVEVEQSEVMADAFEMPGVLQVRPLRRCQGMRCSMRVSRAS